MSGPSSSNCEFRAKDLIVRFEIVVAGTVHAIEPAVARIMDLVGEMSCAKEKGFEIETAVREALANAVEHGCKNDPGKTVQVSVGCDESRGMIIVVRDPGAGFDPLKLPSPVVGERVFAESGRGIYLINQLMDEVRFREGGTEIWMRKQ
jgi:serine/threonine-protein kinase RsbW